MSIQLDKSTEIDRPIEEVFGFVTNPENDEKWHSQVDGVHPPDKEMGVGTTWEWLGEGSLGMGTSELTVECTEYDPPNKFGYRTPSGMFGGRVRTTEGVYTFTREGDKTRVSFSATLEVNGFMRVMKPVLSRMLPKEVKNSLEELKSSLEQPN